MTATAPLDVLIVDDSAAIRKFSSESFARPI